MTTKKFLSILLALALIFALPTICFSGGAYGGLFAAPTKAADLSDLSYEIAGDTVTITGCDAGASGEIIIPAVIEGKQTAAIADYAFRGCELLTRVVISDSVVSIGYEAFCNCSSLEEVIIGNGVTSIDDRAFCNCSSLVNLVIGDGVSTIGEHAFRACTSLAQVALPDGAVNIKESAFFGCSALSGISIGVNNPKYSDVGGVWFNKNKTRLICYPAGKTEISYDIPEGVENICDSAFYACAALTEINIPNSVSSIGYGAFAGCISLTGADLPDGLSVLGVGIFRGCQALTSVSIPESVTSIDYRAFEDCTALTDIYYARSEESWLNIEGHENLSDKNIRYNCLPYLVSWSVEGEITTVEVMCGDLIPVPEDPVKEGSTFMGWSPEIPETMPANDLSFTAAFERNIYTVSWNVDGNITQTEVIFGEAVVPPPAPVKNGYVFTGWLPAAPAVMPANDLSFTAAFDLSYAISIGEPSATVITDSKTLTLNAAIEGVLPEGAKIVWTANNENFEMTVSRDGLSCKVTPVRRGVTTFVASVVGADGTVFSATSQTVRANIGFLQMLFAFINKIIQFFTNVLIKPLVVAF